MQTEATIYNEVLEIPRVKQYNFSRKWRKEITPLLNDPDVLRPLHLGLGLLEEGYEPGTPPWHYGRGPLNGQRAREGCLSWYQPWGRCHHIAPFCWGLGKKLYPELTWGFITSQRHTVVIGYKGDWQKPEWIMDILLFRDHSAQDSFDFLMGEGWEFYPSLARYAATFSEDKESVYRLMCEHLPWTMQPRLQISV